MGNAFRAGLIYFSWAFAAGFALGVLRTVLLAPYAGELNAVIIELPIILAISWVACRWTIKRSVVPALVGKRAVMGGAALMLLLIAEILVSVALAGRSIDEHLMLYRSWPALLGLIGQILFALFPTIQLATEARQHPAR